MRSFSKLSLGLKAAILLTGLAFLTFSCQSVSDLQPQDNDEIPESVLNILRTEFPESGQIRINAIEKDRVWNARLQQKADEFDVVVDRIMVLTNFRLAGDAVPAGYRRVFDSLFIGGGAYSDYRETLEFSTVTNSRDYSVKYKWNDKNYLLKWSVSGAIVGSRYDIYLYPDTDMEYLTPKLNDLPDNIQALINARQGQEFRWANVYIGSDQKKTYKIHLSAGTLELREDGSMIYSTLGKFDNNIGKEKFPATALTAIANDPFAVNFPRFFGEKFEDNGFIGYRALLWNDSQQYYLYFDNSGNVVKKYYMAYPEM
ncbi:hypothetical protein [Dyadobacter helix]|nr:hypothetical protein [Dyadobacter sp. CECT 9275]